MRSLLIQKGHILFREKQASRYIYKLVRGQAEAYKTVQQGEQSLGMVVEGDYFGEIGALVGGERSASVRFRTDGEVLEMSPREFLRQIENDPDALVRLLKLLCMRARALIELLGKTSAQGKKPLGLRGWVRWFFRWSRGLNTMIRFTLNMQINSTSTKVIAGQKFGVRVQFAAGESIFREDDQSSAVFYLHRGRVGIFKNLLPSGLRHIGKISRGLFLGEIGVLEGKSRSANAVVERKVIATRFTPEEFSELLHKHPRVGVFMIIALSTRAYRLTQMVTDDLASGDDVLKDEVRQLLGSFGSMYHLFGYKIEREFDLIRAFLADEASSSREMVEIYQRYVKGEASEAEIERANALLRNYLKAVGVGTLFILPGSVITLPLVVKAAQVFGIDILPKRSKSAA